MADRNLARLAAPLALLVAAVGVVVVVQASRSGSGSGGASPPSTTRTVVTKAARQPRAHRRVYVVEAGDTLTVIAEKTHVSLETIQRLNPEVDPQALQTGQRLKLSP